MALAFQRENEITSRSRRFSVRDTVYGVLPRVAVVASFLFVAAVVAVL